MEIGNKKVIRNITSFENSNNYRKKIHQLIPGGAHTYSKGDDQFPKLSPAAISHGKGAYVWDIDDNVYLDCSMGLTSVSLGHAYEPVLDAIRVELDKGVNFQRPSVLEKETAENFLSLVPQHDMIKFAKNGSIVTTAAVKLARAFTGRKLVAFPSDHPFYSYDDWFIGTTLCNKGVPDEFSKLSVTFKSCDINSLSQLFQQYPDQIACVITEPEKSQCGNGCQCEQRPEVFLKDAIDLAHQNGALFIFDEMVSGFKTHLPGAISKYNLRPDMATWGKGIANGFSFCALTGTKEIMKLGGITNIGEEKVFLISTTHGGETHAMAAANATIEVFKKQNVIVHNQLIGDALIQACQKAILSANISKYVDIISCNWLVAFNFRDDQGQVSAAMRTLAMQEMIKKGVLFQGAFSPCFSHSLEDVSYFVEAFAETLHVLKDAIDNGVDTYLIGEPAKPVFRKLL
jgi:glutamate-1-semialdehyde aminotransferase